MASKASLIWRSVRNWLPLGVFGLVIAFLPLPASTTAPTERHFRIEARSFAFAPAVLAVNPGDQVTIDLVPMDVVHGLSIDGYDLSVTADPGQTASLTFVATRTGTFRFRCAVACGALHPFMLGQLTVGRNWLGWRAAGVVILAALAGIGWKRP